MDKNKWIWRITTLHERFYKDLNTRQFPFSPEEKIEGEPLTLYLGIHGTFLFVCVCVHVRAMHVFLTQMLKHYISPFLLCAYVLEMVPCSYLILCNRGTVFCCLDVPYFI